LIEAAGAFFREPNSTDYWKRIQGWYEGMERVYANYPDDQEVAAFYALALLASAPPDQVTSSNNKRAASILHRLLRDNPDHPGAMHYLIHANDSPGRERESLEVLRQYAAIAPHNPHALHMPTHIYTRLGDWGEVVRGNIKAADAALEFPAGDRGQFIWDEFPHALEYLIYAYLQIGADDEAAKQLERLRGTPDIEPSFKTAFHLASTGARYVLERKSWAEAASVVPRESRIIDWNRFPWPESISWFARGLGSVHVGNLAEARRSLSRMEELQAATGKAGEVLFARNIRVLCLGLAAWLANAEGARDSSVALMTQAADLEAATPKHGVTPAPTLPAYELLGDLLSDQGRGAEALKAYQRSLVTNPRRFNTLLGAARASRAMGDVQTASMFYHQLLDVAGAGSRREPLEEARNFVSGEPRTKTE
jgi:tetratricopeptide (TPR) repeat protein